MTRVAIIDYQMGNLRSVQKGFERVGHHAEIIADPKLILPTDKLVLPGVGAFGDAIAELRKRDFVSLIKDWTAADRPLLGICLGLQMLFDVGYEGGEHEGLGILRGIVKRFELPHEFKVPHMGWNRGKIVRPAPILRETAPDTFFYFVHSYYALPEDPSVIAIETDYGHPFCAAIWQGNLFATQFHPEKSQADGLKLLKSFAEI
jgi:imidazole glycerol-phosphate synthase subunit HisH